MVPLLAFRGKRIDDERPDCHDGGRVVALAASWRHVGLFVAAPRRGRCAARPTAREPRADGPDAAVTLRVGVVTRPATWQNLWGSWPLARYDHAMVYDSDRKVMVMYGGRTARNGPYYDDTWEWDGARGAWNEKTPAPNGSVKHPPSARGHVMVYDTGPEEDVPVQRLAAAGRLLHPRSVGVGRPTATWNERVIAGAQPNAALRRDAWSGTPIATAPSCSAASDDDDRRDAAATTSGSGTAAAPAPGPTERRRRHASRRRACTTRRPTTPFRKKMVVYGGYTGTGAATTGTWVDETWEWDGTARPALDEGHAGLGRLDPLLQRQHPLVYDAGRGKVVAYYYQSYM